MNAKTRATESAETATDTAPAAASAAVSSDASATSAAQREEQRQVNGAVRDARRQAKELKERASDAEAIAVREGVVAQVEATAGNVGGGRRIARREFDADGNPASNRRVRNRA